MNPLFTESEINIVASPAEVWDALVNPELTKHYMYGCEVVSDWKIGSPVLWKGAEDGVTYVSGHLVTLEPQKVFSFTVFDPNAEYEDKPENYLTATYTLTKKGDSTHLHVKQGDYAKVTDGQKRYQDTVAQGGWSAVLENIKKLVESKAG